MTKLTISIPDEQWSHLQELARQTGLSPEELIQTNIHELVEKSKREFDKAVEYLLNKNKELYRRLA